MDGPGGRNDHPLRMQAHCLTMQRRIDQGILIIKGEDHAEERFF